MHYTKDRLSILVWAVGAGALIAGTAVAEAQISPGGGGVPGGPPQQEEKKAGVAEAAPKTPGLLPTTPALPAPKSRRKRWKLFEIDGYYRVRTDWLKNFNLGFPDGGFGGTPFPQALGCKSTFTDHPCDGSLSSANMRLRLEPTINLDEGTSVHIQADLLDNILFGSTPFDRSLAGIYNTTSGITPPLGAFGNGNQAAVEKDVNSDRSSVQIKRAWAEVALPLGVLKVGRMPNHWGMGILHNAGGADPISGGYDYDADYGDTVDRASFSLLIPGTNLRAMIASDWPQTQLVSNQTSANRGHEGHPYDLDDSDDVNRWTGVISRIDSPQEFRDTVDRGDIAFNYGVHFEYTTQSWELDLTDFALGGTPNPARYLPRDMKTYSPDVWAKLGIGSLTLEAEFVTQLGSFRVVTPEGTSFVSKDYDVRTFGAAGRVTWRGADGKLRLGIESGYASGDQWDNTPQGATNIAFRNTGIGSNNDDKIQQFLFNREYKVDMIMWRHLMGAVNNAVYIKPFLQYDLTKAITFKIANITSIAVRPVATPGNADVYGTEFNGDLGYSSGGLFVGLSYGVLFPFAAMAHPIDDEVLGTTYGYTDYTDPANPNGANTGDASTAHTIQSRLVLSF